MSSQPIKYVFEVSVKFNNGPTSYFKIVASDLNRIVEWAKDKGELQSCHRLYKVEII